VHTFSTTLKRRRKEGRKNIIQRVLVDEEAVEKGETYIFEVSRIQKSGEGESVEFEATIHNSDYSFSIPKQVAKENDIYPGDYLTFNIFTREEIDTQEDAGLDKMKDRSEDRFLDTISVREKGNEGRIDSRANSSRVCDYLGEERKPLLIVNKRNGKETVYRTTTHKDRRRFSLRKPVREALDLEVGDTCEVYKVNNADEQKEVEENNTKERIEEIYQMVSELYEAYEQNN